METRPTRGWRKFLEENFLIISFPLNSPCPWGHRNNRQRVEVIGKGPTLCADIDDKSGTKENLIKLSLSKASPSRQPYQCLLCAHERGEEEEKGKINKTFLDISRMKRRRHYARVISHPATTMTELKVVSPIDSRSVSAVRLGKERNASFLSHLCWRQIKREILVGWNGKQKKKCREEETSSHTSTGGLFQQQFTLLRVSTETGENIEQQQIFNEPSKRNGFSIEHKEEFPNFLHRKIPPLPLHRWRSSCSLHFYWQSDKIYFYERETQLFFIVIKYTVQTLSRGWREGGWLNALSSSMGRASGRAELWRNSKLLRLRLHKNERLREQITFNWWSSIKWKQSAIKQIAKIGHFAFVRS